MFYRSIVAFSGDRREIGDAAEKQRAINRENTIHNLKITFGQSDVKTSHEAFETAPMIRVDYMKQRRKFESAQVIAMLLSKLKADANNALHPETVTECVIAIPSYFSNNARNTLLLAAAIADLSCRFLIKETTAVMINYGYQNKFSVRSKMVFIDFGHSSIQICACDFSASKWEIIAEDFLLIGGLDIDLKMTDHFLDILRTKNVKKCLPIDLLDEVEKLKIKMSVNTEELPLNVEHLFGSEISLSMDRDEMEEVCSELFEKLKTWVKKFLEDSGIDPNEIQDIELVGGSSRIPAFKTIIKEVFGKSPLETMNQDEAVSRGCFLRNIMSKKNKNIVIVEKHGDRTSQKQTGLMQIGEVRSNSFYSQFI